MDETTRTRIADLLEKLADEQSWNEELWWRCHDETKANWDDELVAYVYDDVIHYSGLFFERNIFGFRVKPDRYQLEDFREEFRAVANALRSHMSLDDYRQTYE